MNKTQRILASFITLALFVPSLHATGISTNKVLMVNTSNALPPNETNFFAVNSNLLNQSVSLGAAGVSSLDGRTGAVTGVLTNGESAAVSLSNNLALFLPALPGADWLSFYSNGVKSASIDSNLCFRAGPGAANSVAFGQFGNFTNGLFFPASNQVEIVNNGWPALLASNNVLYGNAGGLTNLNASVNGLLPTFNGVGTNTFLTNATTSGETATNLWVQGYAANSLNVQSPTGPYHVAGFWDGATQEAYIDSGGGYTIAGGGVFTGGGSGLTGVPFTAMTGNLAQAQLPTVAITNGQVGAWSSPGAMTGNGSGLTNMVNTNVSLGLNLFQKNPFNGLTLNKYVTNTSTSNMDLYVNITNATTGVYCLAWYQFDTNAANAGITIPPVPFGGYQEAGSTAGWGGQTFILPNIKPGEYGAFSNLYTSTSMQVSSNAAIFHYP